MLQFDEFFNSNCNVKKTRQIEWVLLYIAYELRNLTNFTFCLAETTADAAIVFAESTADAATVLTESTAVLTESTALFNIEVYEPHHDDPEAVSSFSGSSTFVSSSSILSFFGDASGFALD